MVINIMLFVSLLLNAFYMYHIYNLIFVMEQ